VLSSNLRIPSGVVRRPLDQLRVSPGNPRTHSAGQVDQIVRSIEAFGWTNPILVDEHDTIIAGEARYLAGLKMGLPYAPCIVLPGLTAAQRQAYRVADNRIALNAGWDEQALQAVMLELDAVAFDLPLLGFDDAEIARLVEPPVPGSLADADAPAELQPGPPITRPGDIWELGRHRLICGDSTRADVIGRLFGRGAAACVVLTDPPYGMSYDGGRAKADVLLTDPPYGMSFGKGREAGSTEKGATVKAHGMILNDDLQGEALIGLVAGAIGAGLQYTREGGALYVCLTWRTWREFAAAMDRVARPITSCIVWDKGSIGLGYQHYRPQHEFMWYSAGDRWHGGRTESDVWNFSRGNTAGYVHPTQKPVELLERAIRNSSRSGDTVLDVFGGSGSTLIACERTGRAARLVELDPKYCDAIVRRWEAVTGQQASRA
jgi:DNA modification methylase